MNKIIGTLLVGTSFLVHGMNPDMQLMQGIRNRTTQVMQEALARGADVNAAPEPDFVTPLHEATTIGFHEGMQLLINNNANVNAQDFNLQTPLMLAAMRADMAPVQMLLQAGADVDILDGRGWGALAHAVYSAQGANRIPLITLLLEAGAYVNDTDNTGTTPLHWAAYKGDREVAQLLLDYGADIKIQNNNQLTPLSVAEQMGQKEVLKLLAQKAAESQKSYVQEIAKKHR